VTGLNVAVSAGTRLLLITTITSTGLSLVNTVTGYVGGGLAIS